MTDSQKEVTNTIDLHRLLMLIRSNVRLLILWTVLMGVLGFAVAKFVVTPKYTANTEILVNQKHSSNNNGQAYNNQQADVQIINTYKDIITNSVILKQTSSQLNNSSSVAEKYGRNYNMSVSQLKKGIKISNKQNSQVFSVAVTTDDAKKSAATANTIASVFKKRIKKMMSVNNVTIVSQATEPNAPSFPNVKLFTLAGAVLGLLASLIYLIIKELLNTTINSDDFMTEELGLTNLGHIDYIHLDRSSAKINENLRTHSRSERRV
ncbi:YveK family protein [Limosilactobacillus secaliphilus]|uniref:Capsular polysaccharide biosynthesis protein CpsC n=1 Tax=Limosilactobacillus secaliphilus TaxID=396268 RepID=A0A0R2HZR1_9LACO|nr:Wzz/FepE/Etk N-terminal domain-containing protein [Limosilactobacillus secaliphilus]KRN58370.1 polymerization and chain length determination protein [Limosilactobacillus secaliphilus]